MGHGLTPCEAVLHSNTMTWTVGTLGTVDHPEFLTGSSVDGLLCLLADSFLTGEGSVNM